MTARLIRSGVVWQALRNIRHSRQDDGRIELLDQKGNGDNGRNDVAQARIAFRGEDWRVLPLGPGGSCPMLRIPPAAWQCAFPPIGPDQSICFSAATAVRNFPIAWFWKSTSGWLLPAAEKCPAGQRGSIDWNCAPAM
ncbi:MAG: hypothetical protein WDN69_00980 [Aliidongia sp.]